MQKSYNVYFNLGYWFLSLIPLIFAGFYTSYFSTFLLPQASIIHVHFTLMAMWIAMLIAQPFLIKYKKLAIHRFLGKISYVLVPLVLLSAFLMIRYSYYKFIAELSSKVEQGIAQFSKSLILNQAAAYEAIAFYYLFLFMLFYILAVFNRRRTPKHARYMLATALTMLGPTVDRICLFVFDLDKLPGSIPIESAAFIIADFVLILLLIKDNKNKRPTKTLWICLLIYLIAQILYFTIPGTEWWTSFVAFVMKPAP
jgi:hypothetical protein